MTPWTKKEWEDFKKSCQVAMAEWQEKEIKRCQDCDYYYDCCDCGWQNVEAHRQPNGRFGKLYSDAVG